MRRIDELTNPQSCWHKARQDENLFVLLGRDPAFAATVRFWIAERVRLGKNNPGDAQLTEAEEIAAAVEVLHAKPAEKIADFTSKGKF